MEGFWRVINAFATLKDATVPPNNAEHDGVGVVRRRLVWKLELCYSRFGSR